MGMCVYCMETGVYLYCMGTVMCLYYSRIMMYSAMLRHFPVSQTTTVSQETPLLIKVLGTKPKDGLKLQHVSSSSSKKSPSRRLGIHIVAGAHRHNHDTFKVTANTKQNHQIAYQMCIIAMHICTGIVVFILCRDHGVILYMTMLYGALLWCKCPWICLLGWPSALW